MGVIFEKILKKIPARIPDGRRRRSIPGKQSRLLERIPSKNPGEIFEILREEYFRENFLEEYQKQLKKNFGRNP